MRSQGPPQKTPRLRQRPLAFYKDHDRQRRQARSWPLSVPREMQWARKEQPDFQNRL